MGEILASNFKLYQCATWAEGTFPSDDGHIDIFIWDTIVAATP